ncbi:LCP family protein [Candidatus Saccharibacteria bacterium]|nr:LCP family protein [Candidatus Saccharibacteria bacterium]
MSRFKHNQQLRKTVSNVDGFIPTTNGLDSDVRKKFRQNYSPGRDLSAVDTVSQRQEGFDESGGITATPTLGSSPARDRRTSGFDLHLDDDEPKKRFRIFGRKKSQKKKRSPLRRVARGFGIFSLVLVIGAGSILGYGYLKTRQIFRGNGEGAAGLERDVDPSKLNGEGDGRVNILLLGKGGPGHEAPDLTDTILLASIDPIQKEAALLSVPRDTYVQDENGYSTKINATYSNAKQRKLAELGTSDAELQAGEDAGLKAVKEIVSDMLGVPIHYYVMVDFTAFKEAIDTVGGVTIDVKEPLYDSTMAWLNGGSALLADEGLQTFDGNRALMYARSRHGSARGDFDRTERQREVILALQQKVLSLGTFSNPYKVVELMNALGNNVRTDLNGIGELKRLYEIMQEIPSDRFVSVGLADPPNILVTTDFIDNQSVVVPSAGLYQYDDIRSYVRNTLKDAFLRKENARVTILNGTSTAGLATAREKELKSYGYNIVAIDNAPTSDYTQTKLIDVSNGANPYTASYLEKRLSLTKSTEAIVGLPTNDTTDFVIILGSDEASKTTSN